MSNFEIDQFFNDIDIARSLSEVHLRESYFLQRLFQEVSDLNLQFCKQQGGSEVNPNRLKEEVLNNIQYALTEKYQRDTGLNPYVCVTQDHTAVRLEVPFPGGRHEVTIAVVVHGIPDQIANNIGGVMGPMSPGEHPAGRPRIQTEREDLFTGEQ